MDITIPTQQHQVGMHHHSVLIDGAREMTIKPLSALARMEGGVERWKLLYRYKVTENVKRRKADNRARSSEKKGLITQGHHHHEYITNLSTEEREGRESKKVYDESPT